ncbi:GPI mannosyltransferase 2 isoform X2 [Protopterus annectens]|uniref:GPI mannosyltransferase 2 isoform X2 n=1 Tax=Protopterus annectens TaxID=7888 RepID=UPI001CFB1474|nr:GPI mannosyltransferase 2 isoform X2 [Protopterus annectens]
MEDAHLWKVVQFSLCTRLIAIVLQVFFNALIPDHSADAFCPPRLTLSTGWDFIVEILFGGFSHWDAEHFLFIAEYGYLYEHNFAFFPIFPLTVRLIANTFLWPLHGLLSLRSSLLVSAVMLNSALHVVSAVILYRLGCIVLQSRRLAYLSALFFCLNPANIFMAAAYSESMFAFLAFSAMWQLERGGVVSSCLLFSFATGVRSNGIVNAGFLIYSQVKQNIFYSAAVYKHSTVLRQICFHTVKSTLTFLTVLTGTFVILLPFFLFQYYAFLQFCTREMNHQEEIPHPLLELAASKGYRVASTTGEVPSWCAEHYPIIYSYVQDVYWNVGFLRYFQLRQIPNCLLALPVTLLCSWASWYFISADPWYCLKLGLVKTSKQDKPASGFYSPNVFVYLVHCSCLLVFGIFHMHVQVLTRFLCSSSPVLYWFCAHLLQKEPLLDEYSCKLSSCTTRLQADDTSSTSAISLIDRSWKNAMSNSITELFLNWKKCTSTTRCILGYFLSYWMLGLLLHCNFLPWT